MIDWQFSMHDDFIDRRGDLVLHEQGVACPACRGEDYYASNLMENNQPKRIRSLNCNVCQGDGFIYRNARPIRGLLTGIQHGANRQLIEAGFMVPGDCSFSPLLSECPGISDFDRITFSHAQPINEGQVILRNAANMGENVGLEVGLTPDQDRLWYLSDCAIWCEGEDGTLYQQGVDYTLSGKKITWVGNRPPDNTYYVLKYKAYLEWVAWSSPMERVDHGRTLGQKVMLRKKHVYFSTGSPADTAEARTAEQREFTQLLKI